MQALLYPMSFALWVFFLVWLIRAKASGKNGKMPRRGFMLMTLIYFATLLLGSGDLLFKILVGVKDIGVLLFLGILVNKTAHKSALFFPAALAILLFFVFFYFNHSRYQFQHRFGELAEDGEFLVDLKDPAQAQALKEAMADFDAALRPAFPGLASPELTQLDDYFLLDIPREQLREAIFILERLDESPLVDWAEPNEIVSLSLPPQDAPAQQAPINFGLNDPRVGEQWALRQLRLDELMQTLEAGALRPRKVARVFILDTGVDALHQDLAASYQSVDRRYDRDGHSHGTHCAGIVAAVNGNALGVASLNVGGAFLQISSVKVLSDNGSGSQTSIVKGMITAADNGADVISMSLGGPAWGQRTKAYDDAVAYANSKGAIVVVAAGNSDEDARDHSPANCKGVITVAAVDPELKKASFSNTIQNIEMGLCAPGVGILSTVPQDQYKSMSGTSMATPYVAAVLGLLKALRPELTTREAFELLNSTGIETTRRTGNFVQPHRALEALGR